MTGKKPGSVLLIAVLATCSLVQALQGGTLLYEENAEGHVVRDYFPEPPPLHLSSGHARLVLNPSPRLAPCDTLGAGRHAVLGNCSQYLECLPDTTEAVTLRKIGLYHRRVVQCPEGLWFSAIAAECTLQYAASCPYGQLVPNPTRALVTCESEGVHTLPGCGGFYTCRHVSGGMEHYTYTCGEGESWDGELCVPKESVQCSVRAPGAECARTCVAGDTRVCSFTFVIEEFASMSIYCGNCPFTASDCNLPGCIPAGGVAKSVQAINRMVPGPEIQVCKGDTLEIEVQNRLPDGGVTLHWHGLHQTATPHMDGVPYLTQCPVHPGNSFLYRMTADVSGTHMYHSHVGHEETDGMHGVLIVREPRAADPVTSRYDEDLPEQRMLIWHWFERAADVESVDQRIISLRREGFGFLINGKGAVTKRYDSYGTAMTTPLDTFYVTTGKRSRFRSIFNAPINCAVQFSIDGHMLDVLSSDGRPIQALGEMVDSLILTAGERMDFVPHPKAGVTTTGNSFYIRVRGLNDCDDSKGAVYQSAYLRYDRSASKPQGSTAYAGAVRSGRAFNSPRTLPTTLDNVELTGVSLIEATDAATPTPGIGGTPNKIFYVDARFRTFIESGSLVFVVPQMNNITYANPSFPALTQPEDVTASTFCRPSAPTNCVNGWCTCPQLLEVDRGDLVEIVMFDPAGVDLGHPFHLHGYTFRVVAMSTLEGPIFPERLQQMNEAGQITKKFNGPLKDTVSVPGKGYVVLRFFADNPGYWIFHCHITEHMAQGMALVIKVGTPAEMVSPPANFPRLYKKKVRDLPQSFAQLAFDMAASQHSGGCWVTAAILVLISLNVALASMEGVVPNILYEENPAGKVIVDLFDKDPSRMNLVPIVGTFNPSPRLASCTLLRGGRFPVFGNCSQYLECNFVPATNTTIEGFQRRIVECPSGLWFSKDVGDCMIRESDDCPYGQLVPNPVDMPQSNPLQRSLTSGACSKDGEFANPGCRSFSSCIATSTRGVFDRYTYNCDEGSRWDHTQGTHRCVPRNRVLCDVPEEGLECLRDCVAGQSRVCRYTFIVEEYATMSPVYCKNCPFTESDCNLPGCIPAGGVSKLVKSINRRVPGPTIQACKGDTLEIEVQNRLSDSGVTLHWHGLHQRATPHMDGVPYITQCPVLPGNSFLYRMTADVSGTHLYHSHMGHQESDGMFGAMIIREPRANEFGISARYDEDLPQHTMLIWHWFSRAADIESSDTRYGSFRREGYGFIINGKGAVERLFSKDHSSPAAGTSVATPVETYSVQTGRRYRFRTIFNSALNCPVQVSVDGHVLDILATDGRPVGSQTGFVDSFVISAGERVDFVPIPHWSVNTAGRSFLVRVRGLLDCDDRKNGVHQYAYLRYDNSTADPKLNSEGPPTYANAIRSGVGFNLNRDLHNMNSYYIQARSLEASKDANTVLDSRISGTPAKTFYIDARFNGYTETEGIQFIYPQLNSITWQSPPFPPLTQPDSITSSTFCLPEAPHNCQNGLCRCTQMLEVGLNELVELVLVDTGGSPGIGHPFHLHGYAFRVVGMGLFDVATSVQTMKTRNEAGRVPKVFNGPLKDVVIVPARGYAVVRFYADNPGYWLFHCHISEHMAQGMALVVKVGTHAQMVAPPSNFPKCGNYI